MGVDITRHEIYQNPGRYGWTGGFGTTAYNDPSNDMVGILFTQRMMDSPEPPQVFTDFWTRDHLARCRRPSGKRRIWAAAEEPKGFFPRPQ